MTQLQGLAYSSSLPPGFSCHSGRIWARLLLTYGTTFSIDPDFPIIRASKPKAQILYSDWGFPTFTTNYNMLRSRHLPGNHSDLHSDEHGAEVKSRRGGGIIDFMSSFFTIFVST
jgi:hypothetical protein